MATRPREWIWYSVSVLAVAQPTRLVAQTRPAVSATLAVTVARQQRTIDAQQRLLAEQQVAIAELRSRLDRLSSQSSVVAPRDEIATFFDKSDRYSQVPPAASSAQASAAPATSLSTTLELNGSAHPLPSTLQDRQVPTPPLPSRPVPSASMGTLSPVAGISNSPAIKVGGRIQVDAMFYPGAKPGELSDLFFPRLINTDDNVQGFSRTRLGARDTRIFADARFPTSFGGIRAYAEVDFFGTEAPNDQAQLNVSSLRLRHSYLEAGPGIGKWAILVGQTWSTFVDWETFAVSFNAAPYGTAFARQAQIRATKWLSPTFSVSAAVENPQAEFDAVAGPRPEADFDALPDVVVNVRNERGWGSFQASAILRHLTKRDPHISATGWGVNLGGLVHLPLRKSSPDLLRFQINFGTAIGRYISELGPGFDGTIGADGRLGLNRVFAGNVSQEHRLTDWLWTNVGVSTVRVAYDVPVLPNALRETRSGIVNLIFRPIRRMDLGVEYSRGYRRDVDGDDGTASSWHFATRLAF